MRPGARRAMPSDLTPLPVRQVRNESGTARDRLLCRVDGVGGFSFSPAAHSTHICLLYTSNGRRTTSFENLASICTHYNVSADYLLGLIDEPRTLTPPKKEGT